jgi:Protein of unknown function (DUF3761)
VVLGRIAVGLSICGALLLASPMRADDQCSVHASHSEYESSDHVEVHGPDCDNAGVTAHCQDGTLSHSRHHSGTCSRHGGVARWGK